MIGVGVGRDPALPASGSLGKVLERTLVTGQGMLLAHEVLTHTAGTEGQPAVTQDGAPNAPNSPPDLWSQLQGLEMVTAPT